MARNGRVGDPEVIVNVTMFDGIFSHFCCSRNILQFHDGFAYSKGKMEEVFRSGLLDKQPTKPTKEIALAKREDVDLIVTTVLSFDNSEAFLLRPYRSTSLKSPELKRKRLSSRAVEILRKRYLR
jgi:hypothetical protein